MCPDYIVCTYAKLLVLTIDLPSFLLFPPVIRMANIDKLRKSMNRKQSSVRVYVLPRFQHFPWNTKTEGNIQRVKRKFWQVVVGACEKLIDEQNLWAIVKLQFLNKNGHIAFVSQINYVFNRNSEDNVTKQMLFIT